MWYKRYKRKGHCGVFSLMEPLKKLNLKLIMQFHSYFLMCPILDEASWCWWSSK